MNRTSGYIQHIRLAVVLLLAAGLPAYAAEGKSGLSVGHGSLLGSDADPKSPAVGALTAKYGFNVSKELKTYVGTGLAYSIPGEEKQGNGKSTLKTGVAGQAGVSYQIGERFQFNIDYKYIQMAPEQNPTRGNEPPAQKIGVGVDIIF